MFRIGWLALAVAASWATNARATAENHARSLQHQQFHRSLVDIGLDLNVGGSGDATTSSTNSCSTALTPSSPSTFWIEEIAHTGTSPFLGNGSYKVFRNVKDYGAKGDGVTDDSAAIQAAIDDGGRCKAFANCGGTTTKPALVYIPRGTYVLSRNISMYVDTQLVGDKINMPTFKAAPGFSDKYVLDGFPDFAGVATTNFYLQVRNLRIDTTAVDVNYNITCVNWAVAQATSLYNMVFDMAANSQHIGIQEVGEQGGGSATFVGDLAFRGGDRGFILNNQQFAFRGLAFSGVRVGVEIAHVFTATFQDLTFENVQTGIDAGGDDAAGSFILLDSTATNVINVVTTDDSGTGQGSIVIDNLQTTNVQNVVASANGSSILDADGPRVEMWIQGNRYPGAGAGSTYVQHTVASGTGRATALVDSDGKFFTRARPQYEEYGASQFASVQSFGATGDGVTDDTDAINRALAASAGCGITYFPAGTYLVSDTVFVPAGSRIVGEVWSAISASGAAFTDASNPKVVVQLGRAGDRGVVEIQDVVFTVADVLPGAILLEVNIEQESAGDVAMWDTHFRIGGAKGSKVESSCKAAFMLMHVRPTGSLYAENVWGWTADHDLDGTADLTVTAIATGRGYLIETTKAAWFVGSASEHNTLYQYTVANASNVWFSMVQVETPYWQPIPSAPSPWTPNTTYSDPDFSSCDPSDVQCSMAWGFRVLGGSDIYVYGSGFWVFFNNNTQTCADNDGYCQTNMWEVQGEPTRLHIYSLNEKAVKNMITYEGQAVALLEDNKGGWGGVIADYAQWQ